MLQRQRSKANGRWFRKEEEEMWGPNTRGELPLCEWNRERGERANESRLHLMIFLVVCMCTCALHAARFISATSPHTHTQAHTESNMIENFILFSIFLPLLRKRKKINKWKEKNTSVVHLIWTNWVKNECGKMLKRHNHTPYRYKQQQQRQRDEKRDTQTKHPIHASHGWVCHVWVHDLKLDVSKYEHTGTHFTSLIIHRETDIIL